MSDRIVIRPAHQDDRDFVAGLASDLLEFGSPVWENLRALAARFADALARAVDGQSSRAAVLVAGSPAETRLGFISLEVRSDVTGAARAHVADLAVVPAARRTGVGCVLMQAGEAWARAFYRRLGHRPESLCLVKPIADASCVESRAAGAKCPRA